jgi:DNA polymerase (family 10)
MPVHNADIARVFEEIADLLELGNENPFRVRAYRNAARIVGNLALDLAGEVAAGRALPKLPGIGEDLGEKIRDIAVTGTTGLAERLRKRYPAGVTELLRLPGLGPKRVAVLYRSLKIKSLEDLAKAARAGKLRELPGFAEKTEARVLEAASAHLFKARRFLLATAAQYAEPLADYLRKTKGVDEVVLAGSYRRRRETVGDLDILVTAARPAEAMKRFTAYPEVKEVTAAGETRSSVVLACGLQVDVRVVLPESLGAALHYFTGSKAHNIAIRKLAQARGLKLNEYGVFRGAKRVAGDTEASVFAAVGLPWIAPELREDRGEIAAARAGKLPALIELADLRGDLHAHTKATDGRNTVREMALAAKARGLQYLAITDHSERQTQAKGLDAARLAKQLDEIERVAGEISGVAVLRGLEADILEDGTLDLPDDALAGRLDLVVGAVHSKFNLPRSRQTARMLAAMDDPRLAILAHPSGRLLEEREPYDVDMDAIIRKAAERDIALELNAQPQRLDLTDAHCHAAKQVGALVAISSDAHSVDDFGDLALGIDQARRGWLEARDVLNTRSAAELCEWLARRAAAAPKRAAPKRRIPAAG